MGATCLIIGGSFAGKRVAQLLSGLPDLDVVVVEEKSYSEFTPSVLRTLVEPSHAIWAPISASTPARVITQRAVSIQPSKDGQPGEVVLSDGSSLAYNFLVLATGSGYLWPIKAPSGESGTRSDEADWPKRKEALSNAASQIADASSVVVVGGGPVGVELAAELAGKFGRSKAITLLTSGDRLLARMPERAGQAASRWLRLSGVEVLLGERASQWSQGSRERMCGGTLTTQSGRSITADLILDCTGVHPNTQLYDENLKAKQGTQKAGVPGVPVQPTLEMVGCPGVFACGDVAAVTCERTAYTADLMANVVGKNIAHLSQASKHRGTSGLVTFPGGAIGSSKIWSRLKQTPSIAAISLYKYNGIFQVDSLVIPGPAAALGKYAVEFFQLGMAKGNSTLAWVWAVIESVNTKLAALPLLLKEKWMALKAYEAI